jgi:hypothetical protein
MPRWRTVGEFVDVGVGELGAWVVGVFVDETDRGAQRQADGCRGCPLCDLRRFVGGACALRRSGPWQLRGCIELLFEEIELSSRHLLPRQSHERIVR